MQNGAVSQSLTAIAIAGINAGGTLEEPPRRQDRFVEQALRWLRTSSGTEDQPGSVAAAPAAAAAAAA